MASISSRYPRCPYLGSRGLLPQSVTTRRQHCCSPACTCAADSARWQRSKLPHQLIHDVRPVARISRQALPSRFRSCVSHCAPATSSPLGGNSEQRRRPPPPRTPQPSERRFAGEPLAESLVEDTRSTVTKCPSRLCPVTFFPCARLPHLTLPELATQFSCFKSFCTSGVQEAPFLFAMLLRGLRHVRHALASAAAFLSSLAMTTQLAGSNLNCTVGPCLLPTRYVYECCEPRLLPVDLQLSLLSDFTATVKSKLRTA